MYKQYYGQEEQETTINVDYMGGVVYIYSNKATVMNRMIRKGFDKCEEHVRAIEKLDDEGNVVSKERVVVACTWVLDFSEMSKVMSSSIFRCGARD